jgi:DNA repair protein RadC
VTSAAEYKSKLKERFRASSLEGFDDLEKLSLLLSFGTPVKDVRGVARELQKVRGSLRAVMDSTPEELASVEGVGESTATFFLLLKEVAATYLSGSLVGTEVDGSFDDLIDLLRLTLSSARIEKFLAVYMDADGKVEAIELLHEGTINRTVVYPRKAIELALAHKAASVIFVHNHPSGDPTPSRSDHELAAALEAAAATIDLKVRDHIVIAGVGYFSAKRDG